MTVKRAQVEYNDQVYEVLVNPDGRLVTDSGQTIAESDVRWLPPHHGTVICVALNNKTHISELEEIFHQPPHLHPPNHPVLFLKTPNTLTGHQQPVQCPDGVEAIQAGPALCLVLGKTTFRVTLEEAMDMISGYTLLNDFSLPEVSYYRPPVKSKGYDSFGPLGPYIVDAQAIEDPQNLAIRTYINGELRQEDNTSNVVRNIPELIVAISQFMTLQPGDMISTGFPAGRVDVHPGDHVAIEVDKVGRLENHIVTETEYYTK